jgi:PAS domain S-box-containing protein
MIGPALPSSLISVPDVSPVRPGHDLEAFLALISSLSGRLAGATGEAVDREVDAGLRELLTFFGVEQCGILEIQPDRRKARLRHFAHVDGVTPVPATLDYGTALPWSHERAMRGQTFVQTCIDDLPAEAVVDRTAAAALGLQTIVSIPVGIGGRITHVLALVSSQSVHGWHEAILGRLQMVAETFLAVLTRRSVEQALAQSERTLAQAQQVAGVGSYVCDWSGGTIEASAEAERIFGGALGAAAAGLFDRVHPGDRTQVREEMERMFAAAAPSVDLEYRIVRSDGEVCTVRIRAETTYGPDGKPERTLVTIQDISHLRAAEEELRRLGVELRHADRAAHLGALTASLSHELNQPLTGILANSQAGLRLLAQQRADPAELHAIFESIVRDNKRAASVISNLRFLLRREEPAREPVDVADAIQEVLALFKGEIEASNVNLETELEQGCETTGVKTQIQQVMVNLLSNAVHALRDRAVSDRNLEVKLDRVGDGQAEISVRDNGMGISPDRLPRIFEPFFSTKTDGLGMGLAITRSIVESHGGEIAVQTQVTGGTTFRVLLPVEPARAARPASGSTATDDAQRMGASDADITVCVVDDDPAIREGLMRLLGAAGMRVVAFESGRAALASPELAAAHCLVLDVQMPEMSGTELQSEVRHRGISADVIFLTARSDAETGVYAMKHGALEYLCKPVEDGALLDAVHIAIGRYAERMHTVRERERAEGRLVSLTARERDVLREVIAGRLNKQIAERLSISEATVKQHRGQLMKKLQARSVAELVRLCQIAGFPAGS